ncbi:MAG: glycosyltransferase family 4 protein [Candidatus Latescibacterota bacterium]|nr:MAG: glycosyltransferase family 4 protein [Candidatus Latescibacterota bacterium]
MFNRTETWQRARGVAFVGNYLPRVCGIATFTFDLAEAVAKQVGKDQPVIVTAMNDQPEGYAYPERVKFEVRQEHLLDYSRAADFLNFSHIDVINLQHEYGIFGGEWGSNLLALVRDLHRPLVTTCHTIVEDLEPVQEDVFKELAARSAKLIVMSKKAVRLLEEIYAVNRDKIVVVPHGIHDVPFVDPNYYKDKFGVEGRNMLLTFGLLHENKGIEYMIEALPAVVERHPETTYLILGTTHPNVVAAEGEAYRLRLQRRVRELGLEEHVLFHPRFVELEELLEYIGASDICVTPYLALKQITSGALTYAMGSGKAVVSTPYWHAEELLADGRGRLVPVRDPKALAREILDLLDNRVKLNAMRKKAYLYCRNMTWSAVASVYVKLFDEVRSRLPKTIPTASAMRRPLVPTNLPLPRLDHLIRLSDDTGVAHHASHTVPDWRYGYRMEDAAAAIVACVKFLKLLADERAAHLAETCLGLLHILIGDGTNPSEGLQYTRARMSEASQPSVSRAIWGLGYVVAQGPPTLAPVANDLFQNLLPHASLDDLRGCGYATLGANNYLSRFPGASDVRRYLARHAEILRSGCESSDWIARWDASDWPVAVQALTIAATRLGSEETRKLARNLVGELLDVTSNGTVFHRPGENPDEEELPVSAATFIEALGAVFYDERDRALLGPIRAAADWFLGDNRKGTAIYDFSTGGCHDAVTASGLNRNQGTEATVFCLIAFSTLHRLAGMDASEGSGAGSK